MSRYEDIELYNNLKKEFGYEFSKMEEWYRTTHHLPKDTVKYLPKPNLLAMRNRWFILNHLKSLCKNDCASIPVDAIDGSYAVCRRVFAKDSRPDHTLDGDTKENIRKELEVLGITMTNSVFKNKRKQDLSDELREAKINYINECLSTFKLQTDTELLHKENLDILKFGFDNLEFIGNEVLFDSSKASRVVNGDIEVRDSQMVWVSTAEDGISRILRAKGLSQVIVFMGKDEEDNPELIQMKERIFLHGIRDKATGKKYLVSAPSASATRHADFPFVEASHPRDVYKLWCEITGFNNMSHLLSNLGSEITLDNVIDPEVLAKIPEFKDDSDLFNVRVNFNGDEVIAHGFKINGQVKVYALNIAKLKARIAMRGSNSFDLFKMTKSSSILDILKNPNVDYVKDPSGTVTVPYKTITAPGVLSFGDESVIV